MKQRKYLREAICPQCDKLFKVARLTELLFCSEPCLKAYKRKPYGPTRKLVDEGYWYNTHSVIKIIR